MDQEQEQIGLIQISEVQNVERSNQSYLQDISGKHDVAIVPRQFSGRFGNVRLHPIPSNFLPYHIISHSGTQSPQDDHSLHLPCDQDLLLGSSTPKHHCSREDLSQDESDRRLEELVIKLPEKLEALCVQRRRKRKNNVP